MIKKYDFIGRRPNENDVTSDGRLVYLPIFGEGIYQVFDAEKEAIIAEIPTDGFPHNVVISPDDKYAYLSPMDRGTTSVIQLPNGSSPKRMLVLDVPVD